jgi:hypothetical protein
MLRAQRVRVAHPRRTIPQRSSGYAPARRSVGAVSRCPAARRHGCRGLLGPARRSVGPADVTRSPPGLACTTLTSVRIVVARNVIRRVGARGALRVGQAGHPIVRPWHAPPVWPMAINMIHQRPESRCHRPWRCRKERAPHVWVVGGSFGGCVDPNGVNDGSVRGRKTLRVGPFDSLTPAVAAPTLADRAAVRTPGPCSGRAWVAYVVVGGSPWRRPW